jgi:cytidylate kinase
LGEPSTIAVDGTAASGKSTIGALLADALGYLYFDTGVMYRAVTWAALDRGVDIADEEAVTALARRLQIEVSRPDVEDGRQYTIRADGEDITWAIRQEAVNHGVSPVSAYPGVRQALTTQQRAVARQGRVVMVGRDIGTVVLPNADLKLYLDATLEERATRRHKEEIEHGRESDLGPVLASLRRRDEIDSGRAVAPLRCADDAVAIDTTGMTIDEVLARALNLVHAWCSEE